jgi:hypothetical protein
LAQITKTSAMGLFEIHDFVPVSDQPPATFFARVSMPAGSEPKFGSVRPKQPMSSPFASFGRYFSLVASVPNSAIGSITREDCTLIIER